jgi:hypothetical protein
MDNLETIKENFIETIKTFNIETETHASKLHVVWEDGPKGPIFKGNFRIEIYFDPKE